MATIKSFTSLEQSKKLAKILPLESADMVWEYQTDRFVGEPDYLNNPQFGYVIDKRDIACWSLAALLGVLPDTIDGIESYGRLTIDKEGDAYNISYDDILSEESIILFSEYSLIDACVAMIEKLHELNLL